MSKFIQGTCVYCGNVGDVTEDHVIPQCLFPGRVPKDVPIVPACPTCNGVMKSSFDSYLRDLLVVDISSYETPIAQQLRPKFQRAFVRNQSKLMHDFLNNYEILDMVDASGKVVKRVVASERVNELTQTIMMMVVRGLYYFYFDTPLPSTIPIKVIRVFNRDFFEQTEGELYERGGFYAPIGEGDVFECAFGFLLEDPRISIWLLTFYRSTMMMVYTGRELVENDQTT